MASQLAEMEAEEEGTVEFDLSISEELPSRDLQQCVQPPETMMSTKHSAYRHGSVPKTVDLESEYAKRPSSQPVTTLMIRNVPNFYTQRVLVAELRRLGLPSVASTRRTELGHVVWVVRTAGGDVVRTEAGANADTIECAIDATSIVFVAVRIFMAFAVTMAQSRGERNSEYS